MIDFQSTHDSQDNRNLGGHTSFGTSGQTAITWKGEANGVEPIDVVRATLDRLQFVQKTTSASEPNGKLLVKLLQAVEEFDGKPPSIGGALNNLIPKE